MNREPPTRCSKTGCRGWCYAGHRYCRTHRFETAQKVADWRAKTKGASVGGVTKSLDSTRDLCLPSHCDDRGKHTAEQDGESRPQVTAQGDGD